MNDYRRPRKLDSSSANRILQAAFENSQMESNTIPLETIESYSNYRRERFIAQRILAAFMLLVFLLLPLLFLMPHAEEVQVEDVEPGRPAYQITVGRKLMVNNVVAEIEGVQMPVLQKDRGVYSVQPTTNGEMTVTVTLINKQYQVFNILVTGVDLETPFLVENALNDGVVCLVVDDNGSGVDFEAVYAKNIEGSIIKPLSYNEETQQVFFAFPESSINVYIPDKVGNILQLVIAPKFS